MTIDEQIASLEEAIAAGVRKIVTQSQGVRTEIEYQSTDQMERALAKLKARKAGGPRTNLVAF
ncbi:phage head-tail joining protein [Devosia sp. XGJD_8]|uniref:phage head-tail joining protein n=1 Tax=Devosia sp. XGJD_8 TaxID=3391187 RepID=UPI0039848D15